MGKLKEILRLQKDGEVFTLGSDNHRIIDTVRSAHNSPGSVHDHHHDFYGAALRIRRKMNN